MAPCPHHRPDSNSQRHRHLGLANLVSCRGKDYITGVSPLPDAQGLAEYRRLFTELLVDKERTVEGIRLWFRDGVGIEAWLRDLAAREEACCAFFAFTVTRTGGEVLLDGSVIDDDTARAILEEFYNLPGTLAEDDVTVEEVDARFTRHGFEVRRPSR